MGFKILTIPFDKEKKEFDNDIIEKMLGNKKIKNFKIEFINLGEEFFWTVFVEYEDLVGIEGFLPKKGELSEAEATLLSKLKEWRSLKAKEAGIPSYVIAKNEHFIEIIKQKPKSLQELKLINGIGDKKIKEYGEDILKILTHFYGGK